MTDRAEALQLLGLTPDATPTEVRAAFRRKVIEHHPDTSSGGTDGSTIRALITAYHQLTDRTPGASSGRRADIGAPTGSTDTRGRVSADQTEMSQMFTRQRSWCRACMATGLRSRVVTCPACRGASLVTALEVGRAQVVTCRRCRGRGQIRSWRVCGACRGTGLDGS